MRALRVVGVVDGHAVPVLREEARRRGAEPGAARRDQGDGDVGGGGGGRHGVGTATYMRRQGRWPVQMRNRDRGRASEITLFQFPFPILGWRSFKCFFQCCDCLLYYTNEVV